MNLRSDQLTPIQELVKLFQSRKENIKNKYQIEEEITNQNTRMIQFFQSVLKPIVKRTGIGFNLCIEDYCVIASIMVIRKGNSRVEPESFRVSITLPEIEDLLSSAKNFTYYTRMLYIWLRYCKTLLKLSPKFTIPQESTVTVTIKTKTRYFG